MKIFCLSLTIVSVLFTAFSQPQPKMVAVEPDTAIELRNFSMRVPSGEGWRMTKTDVDTVELRLQNDRLMVGIRVLDQVLDKPPANPEEKLAELSRSNEKVFAQHAKITHTEHTIEKRDGAQCLSQSTILNSPELQEPGKPSADTAIHSLQCIYGADHRGLAEFQFIHPMQGKPDDQKKLAQEFFAGVTFKAPAAK